MTEPASLLAEPSPATWAGLARAEHGRTDRVLGRTLADWRAETRAALGLRTDVPVVGSGHQPVLWHPGILAKYVLMDAVAGDDLGAMHLVVDQHDGPFAAFEVPVRTASGALAVRRLAPPNARDDVVMARHPAVAPPAPLASPPEVAPALPSVGAGVDAIRAAMAAHRDAPNAAIQMTRVLDDLRAPWTPPAPIVTASMLAATPFARALQVAMVRDPEACARAYAAAVRAVPEAGIGPLARGLDWTELPWWRLDDAGRRRRAFDADLERALDDDAGSTSVPALLPRALAMTALVRLVACDVFIHGTGGATYDRAMAVWIERWLGVRVAPAVAASATLRLPLLSSPAPTGGELAQAIARAHRSWHDPEDRAAGASGPGPVKADLLAALDAAPRGSVRRRRAFHAMHAEIATLRGMHAGRVERDQRRAAETRAAAVDAAIAQRRDWAFPLHDPEALDAMAAALRARAAGG